MPNVKGLKVDAATKALEDSYYLVIVQQRESEQTEGTVLEQSIPASTSGLDAWTTVILTVSHYVESKKVEDYRGKTLQEAKNMMEFYGLVCGSVLYEPSILYAKGTIIRQSIDPGTSVLPGTVIEVTIRHTDGTD